MNRSVLVIDDEADIRDLVSYNLKREDFRVTVAEDGEQGLDWIRKRKFDLVVLDLMLPDIQGIEICRVIRNDPKTERLPVIMLTARSGETDRVRGLESGADDYLVKPFSPRELIARVRAILRRTDEGSAVQKTIRLGDLVINTDTYSVSRGGEQLDLSATEYRLLLYLVERRGKVFSREQLLDGVWKGEAFIEPRTIDVHIRRLRAQIEDDPAHPVYLKTRRGIGYYVE